MPVTLEKSNVGRHLLAARCRLLLSQAVRHPDQCYVLLRPAKASAFQGGDCDANIVACSCGLILFANLGATHAAPLSHECQITRWRKVAQLVKRCRPSFQLLQRATCPPALMLARRGRQTKDVERRRNVRSGSKMEVSGARAARPFYPQEQDIVSLPRHVRLVPGSEVAIHGSSLRAKAIRPAQHDFAALFRDPSQGG